MDQKKFDEYLIGYIDREEEDFSLEKLKEEAKVGPNLRRTRLPNFNQEFASVT